MTAKHTPGPWYADKIEGRTAFNIFPAGATHALVQVGGPIYDGAHPYSMASEANARLIAAAPDLLEALQSAHDALLVSYPLHSIDMDKRGAILGWARAAIAKATGEQA